MRVLVFSPYRWREPTLGAAQALQGVTACLRASSVTVDVVCGPAERTKTACVEYLSAIGIAGTYRTGLVEIEEADGTCVHSFEHDPVDARDAAEAQLLTRPPDVLMTQSAGPDVERLWTLCARIGVPVVHRLAGMYRAIDRSPSVLRALRRSITVIAPSRFVADYYRTSHGLVSTPLLAPVTPSPRGEGTASWVTFVGAVPSKGLAWLAGVARGLRGRDIPLRVVVGRGDVRWVEELGLSRFARVEGAIHDRRHLFATSRLWLAPSLAEPSGRAVAEAMAAGVPVLTSDRGGLPETVGFGGLCLPVSGDAQDVRARVPDEREVAGWRDYIARIVTDDVAHAVAATAARQRGAELTPARLASDYRAVLDAAVSRRAQGQVVHGALDTH